MVPSSAAEEESTRKGGREGEEFKKSILRLKIEFSRPHLRGPFCVGEILYFFLMFKN